MGAYGTPSGDGLAPLIDKLKDLQTQLRDLQTPSGTNIGSLVAQVQTALINLSAQVQAEISANSYTKTVIDGKIASPGAISPTTVSATGAVSGATVTGVDVFAQSLATNITAARVSLWGRTADGYIATAASSERFKTNIRPVDRDPRSLMGIVVSYFEYIDEVRKRDDPSFDEYVGPDYHVGINVGVIAERLHELGLWEYVIYERDGSDNLKLTDEGEPVPYGVHDILLAYAIIPFVQMQDRRMDALASRLEAIDGLAEPVDFYSPA